MATYHATEKVSQESQIPKLLAEYGYGRNEVKFQSSKVAGALELKIPIDLEIRDEVLKPIKPGQKARPSITSPSNQGPTESQSGGGRIIEFGVPTLYQPGHDYGIDVRMKRWNKVTKRYHKACKRVRWIQTVDKRVGKQHRHFVDVNGKVPFYGTDQFNENGLSEFDDAPCTGPNEKTVWTAVLSLVTWEGKNKLHIHDALQYGYKVRPGKQGPRIDLVPAMPATGTQIAKHKALVEKFRDGYKFI